MELGIPLADDSCSNDKIQQLISQMVAGKILGSEDNVRLETGPLCINQFSFTFSIRLKSPKSTRDVFVKIPKVDIRGVMPKILPITEDDREMAIAEVSSLKLLAQRWGDDDLGTSWVSLCDVVPEYNAIITDRVFATEAFSVFRRLDLKRRLGNRKDANRLQSLMASLGVALGRFHQTNIKETEFRLLDMLPKIEFYCQEITQNTSSIWPDQVIQKLNAMGDLQLRGIEVATLKGIDIRNVLIDKQYRMTLLDPGKTKLTYREADLARFLMTFRILFWGSKLFLFSHEPDPQAEKAFLKSYYSVAQASSSLLLDLYILKEQLKHWHTALDSLCKKNWSYGIKRLITRIYVNPFYERQISSQLKLISENE